MNSDFTLIYKNFDLEPSSFNQQDYSQEQFREHIANVIAHLIHTDMERLLWILYRLDISEKKAISALSLAKMPNLALADLVIERELQKIRTRQEYKQWQESQSNKEEIEHIEAW